MNFTPKLSIYPKLGGILINSQIIHKLWTILATLGETATSCGSFLCETKNAPT